MIKHDIVSEKEAWFLFRVTAISEAFTWLLLLTGILIKYVLIPGNQTWVAVGGSIHGIVYLAYFAVVVLLWKPLRFNFLFILIALAASVIPFGTLVLELWLAHRRKREENPDVQQVAVRAIIMHNDTILAIQPIDRVFWCLPGGAIEAGESPEEALARSVNAQTGITPVIGKLERVFQYNHSPYARLEFFYTVTNSSEYVAVSKTQSFVTSAEFDELKFIPIDGSIELKPDFLVKK